MTRDRNTTIQEFSSGSQESSDQSGGATGASNNLRKVPDHWDCRQFQHWAKKKNDKGDGQELPFVTLEHINSTTGDLTENFEWETKDSEEYYLFQQGDVLFGKLRPYLRKYYRPDRNGCCGTDLLVLRPATDVNSNFLYYFLHSEDFIQYTEANSHGVKMPRISWKKISSAKFGLPPTGEQKQIVNFLDGQVAELDNLINKKENLISLINEKKLSIIKDTVKNGLESDPDVKQVGVDWIGEVPEHWDVPRIRFVARMESGHTPTKSESDYWDGNIQWVSLADSKYLRENDYISTTEKQITKEGLKNSSARILPPETMVFTRDATIGLCAITTCEMAVSQHIIGWICEDNLLPEYLLYVTKSMDQELDRLTMGATISTVGMEDIKKLKMPLPPIEEQKQIVKFLNEELKKFDNSTGKIQEGIDRLKEYRTALITEAVTGQIDVRGEV